MVEVHHDHIVANVEHTSHKTIALLILHGHYSIDAHMFMIELAVDAEQFLVHLDNALLVEIAIGLIGCQREIELVAFLQFLDLLLERLDGDTKSADEGKRSVGRHFFYEMTARIVVGIQLIRHCDQLVLFLFHIYKIGVSLLYFTSKIVSLCKDNKNLADILTCVKKSDCLRTQSIKMFVGTPKSAYLCTVKMTTG